MAKRPANYWQQRRRKQLGRFGTKVVKGVVDPSIANTARAAWSGVKYLRTLINSETHKRDTGVQTTTPTTTATVFHLTAIAQGDADNERTGLSLLSKYLSCKFAVLVSGSATQSLLRILVVQDKQQIADTTPAITDVLSANSTMAFINNASLERFTVLYDRVMSLDNVAAKTEYFSWYYDFKGKNNHVRFNGTASSDIQKNGIYLMLLSSEATNSPQVIHNSRFAWYDN